MKILTVAQMQALDRRTIVAAGIPGLTLMERAGTHVADLVREIRGSATDGLTTIVCGKGNNGGDGLVAARLLAKRGITVQVVLLHDPAGVTGDAKVMWLRWKKGSGPRATLISPTLDRLRSLLGKSLVVVDAILGTGLTSEVSGAYRAAIECMNECGRPIVAVDLPSGIHADTGAIMGVAVRATATVTLGHPKIGLFVGPGLDHAGIVRVGDIGIPASLSDQVPSALGLLSQTDIARLVPDRRASSHKGTFGHAAIIAGSIGKTGAAALAAKAALRVGTGLVSVATPSGVNATLEAKVLEVMTVPMPETKAHTLSRTGLDRLLTFVSSRTAAAIGPGLSTHPETVDLVQALIPRLEKPTVLDADALNALAGKTRLLGESKAPLVLTPHPGEMARLVDDATPESINADRIGTAQRLASARDVIVVLKGARTIVARPDGEAAICPMGNAGMATAGTGDVLTGMIAGLMAQRLSPWDAARVAVYLHGLAGDLAAAEMGQAGMIAGDLLDRIPKAISKTVGR
ncbi:MAG: NAD(P)H-hydrate dehydratase [Nitrospirae bacterium]|nr:NAD(P)H-hydrate dehydratase [Nitrospirota bacterium]